MLVVNLLGHSREVEQVSPDHWTGPANGSVVRINKVTMII